ncbi:TatD family hydrolase [Pleionea sp. CnH1-48]|uniref:TatD family hydrolase n=1 Tax=Pleionea sp. CnH1-48 TaxID=2954494 RepID=UPI002097D721|nr:TatD family hydrolase [Pleionea sp. CnH1-48]MCO7225376.1 TatD family hydrolase [Pleionea sp. CnH1-48]
MTDPDHQYHLFDTHCHLDFPEFNSDRKKLLSVAEEHGLYGMVVPGVKRNGWRFIRQLSALHTNVHSALGLHPMFIDEHTEQDLHDLELALSVGPLAAVGEIGLDYYNGRDNQTRQEKFFHQQLHMAKDCHLPVILHSRKAHEDVLKQIRMLNYTEGGVVHAFNGDLNQAKRYCDAGFKLGVGGAITYQRAVKLRAMVKELPLDSIVLETDAPDMPPATCKTKRNTPLHIFDNFRALCALREEPPLQIAEQSTHNAYSALRIKNNHE